MAYEFSISATKTAAIHDEADMPSRMWRNLLKADGRSVLPRTSNRRYYVPMWRMVSDSLSEGTLCIAGSRRSGSMDETICRVYRQIKL